MPGDHGAAWRAAWEALTAADGVDGAGTVTGEVVASFGAAVYLRLGGEVVALVAESSAPGPLHARLARLPTCRPGAPAVLRDGGLWVDDSRVLLPAHEWNPEPVADPLAAAPLLTRLVSHVPELDLDGDARTWTTFVQRLDDGDLPGACARVVGRGRGLTPAGDDAAAGALLVHALTGRTSPEVLADIARAAPTHEISRAFLGWAARGQAIEPVHQLVDAAAVGDDAGVRSALRRLAAVGHTSGMDIAAGVTAALAGLVSVRRPETRAISHTAR